jgi:hypothetical protein
MGADDSGVPPQRHFSPEAIVASVVRGEPERPVHKKGERPQTSPPGASHAPAFSPGPASEGRDDVKASLIAEIRRQLEEIAKQPTGTREAAAALRDLAEALSLVRSIR